MLMPFPSKSGWKAKGESQCHETIFHKMSFLIRCFAATRLEHLRPLLQESVLWIYKSSWSMSNTPLGNPLLAERWGDLAHQSDANLCWGMSDCRFDSLSAWTSQEKSPRIKTESHLCHLLHLLHKHTASHCLWSGIWEPCLFVYSPLGRRPASCNQMQNHDMTTDNSFCFQIKHVITCIQ